MLCAFQILTTFEANSATAIDIEIGNIEPENAPGGSSGVRWSSQRSSQRPRASLGAARACQPGAGQSWAGADDAGLG